MRIWNRLRRWIGRRQFEADLEEEIRIHREMERDYRAAGGEGRHFGSAALALEQSPIQRPRTENDLGHAS